MAMKILLCNISKRYNKQWIFKDCSYTIESGKKYAITGTNGSGKSTLLQCIAGATQLSKGNIEYTIQDAKIESDKAFQYLTFSAPYLELLEELTLTEMLDFHLKFKPFYENISIEFVLEKVNLITSKDKQIGNFSSGMKQRLKLALAFFSKSDLILLDEPTANLDAEGILLYKDLIKNHLHHRTTIISSNDVNEYDFCDKVINIEDYK
jgi:ABC-type multidrug transport system ATPase subunit